MEKPFICFAPGDFAPWTPNGALPLYPAGGLGSPQAPRLAWVLPTLLHSPSTSNLFDNPGGLCDYEKKEKTMLFEVI